MPSALLMTQKEDLSFLKVTFGKPNKKLYFPESFKPIAQVHQLLINIFGYMDE